MLSFLLLIASCISGGGNESVTPREEKAADLRLTTLERALVETSPITFTGLDDAQDKLVGLMEDENAYVRGVESLIVFLYNTPESLDYGFDLIRERYNIDIVTSPDGDFRIYAWENGYGGRQTDRYNLVQYRHGSQVSVVEGNYLPLHIIPGKLGDDGLPLLWMEPKPEWIPGKRPMAIEKICCDDGMPIYLVSSSLGYGGTDVDYFLTGYTVRNGLLLKADVLPDGGLDIYLHPGPESGSPFSLDKEKGLLYVEGPDTVKVYRFNGYIFKEVSE